MEQKENTGAIFLNDKREKDTQPMYKGKLNYKGQDIEIALWVRDGKNGKFFSAKLSEPYQKTDTPKVDLPF
jgi:hypothetical protein